MEVNELVNAIDIVQLPATTRTNAVRELVDAVNWAHENVLPDDVVKAIEEREATAQTIVDKGLALFHAMIEWSGDFRLVFGRSQAGVDYLASGDKLHLIVLLVIGKGRARTHLEVRAALAELLKDDGCHRQPVHGNGHHISRRWRRRNNNMTLVTSSFDSITEQGHSS